VNGRYADCRPAWAYWPYRAPFSRLFSSLTCVTGRAQRTRRGVAAVMLCQLLLVSACATQTGRQQAAADVVGGIAVVPLVDGATRVDIATDSAFDFGSAVLRTAFAAQLGQLINPYNGRQVQVSGYTDNVGAPAFNLDLSQRRARAVADVLLEQGFTAARITVSGYGEDNPVASNATEAGRRLNRRIEILLTTSQLPDDR
jgi:outer membrane protein OmpA-like peptidoglycan-associated protein